MFRRPPESLSVSSPSLWLATWFGSGLLRPGPGTWGTLAALPVAWVIHAAGGGWALLAAAAILFYPGVRAADGFMAASGEHDPGPVVVDEVVGVWLVLSALPRPDLAFYVLGFALFRLFDIVKPWPVSWADKRVGGGFGVMLDDVLAGLYAAAALVLIHMYVWPGLGTTPWTTPL
jgi:phosphatidylglycerophosphatase A